jgi:hypothetical protein
LSIVDLVSSAHTYSSFVPAKTRYFVCPNSGSAGMIVLANGKIPAIQIIPP